MNNMGNVSPRDTNQPAENQASPEVASVKSSVSIELTEGEILKKMYYDITMPKYEKTEQDLKDKDFSLITGKKENTEQDLEEKGIDQVETERSTTPTPHTSPSLRRALPQPVQRRENNLGRQQAIFWSDLLDKKKS